MTSLTVNGSAAAATTLAAAGKMFNATGGTSGNTSTKVTTSTGHKQIFAKGTTTTQTGAGTRPAPTDSNFNGWMWDVTTLEGQRIAAGTWTPTIHLLASTSTTVTPTVEWYKRSSAGAYTQIGTVTGNSIALTTSSQLLVFSAPSLALMDFATGDKLVMWLWVNQTAGGGSTSTISVVEATSSSSAGVTSEAQAVTPGYSRTPTNKDIVSRLRLMSPTSFRDITSRLTLFGTNHYDCDSFTRANQSGFGTGTCGSTWATQMGTPTLSVSSNSGAMTNVTALSFVQLGSKQLTDADACCRIKWPSANTSALGIALRATASNTFYRFRLNSGSSTNALGIVKTIGGSSTNIIQGNFTFTTGNFYRMRARVAGSTLSLKFWADGTAEPSTWNLTATDTSIVGTGGFGVIVNSAAAGDINLVDSFWVDGAGSDVSTRFVLTSGGTQATGDTASRIRLMSATQLKDIAARLRLMSATQFRDVATRFRLVSALLLKDTSLRLRLVSATNLRDIMSRLRLMSALLRRDITARLRLILSRDTVTRLRLMSVGQWKDITTRLRLMSAIQLKDVASRLRLMSASQRRDTASRLRLAVFRDIVGRLRLQSATQFKDIISRLRLMSASQLKDVAARLRLRSANQLKDMAARLRLAKFRDVVTRLRLRSANQLKDIASRFILGLAGSRLKDLTTRMRLQSANQLKDAASRLRLASAIQHRDTTLRLRLMSVIQMFDIVTRLRLMSAVQLKDIATRMQLISAVQWKDIAGVLHLRSAAQMRDIVGRLCLHISALYRTKDVSARFVLSIPSMHMAWVTDDMRLDWVTDDMRLDWVTDDMRLDWRTEN